MFTLLERNLDHSRHRYHQHRDLPRTRSGRNIRDAFGTRLVLETGRYFVIRDFRTIRYASCSPSVRRLISSRAVLKCVDLSDRPGLTKQTTSRTWQTDAFRHHSSSKQSKVAFERSGRLLGQGPLSVTERKWFKRKKVRPGKRLNGARKFMCKLCSLVLAIFEIRSAKVWLALSAVWDSIEIGWRECCGIWWKVGVR